MAKVLNGVRVLDMGTFITGPAAGVLLADMGADVVKIENPNGGDPFRAFKGDYYSPHYQTYNRNKRSITLNTKDAADLAKLDELVKSADVFIENFRPGVAQRLGIDFERLQAINPKLVYCSISGFGADGPDKSRPAFDTVAQAASGFLRLLVNPEHPRVVGPAIADAITGFYAAYGVLGALFERHATGKGRLVEVSMLEAMCHFNMDDFAHLFSEDMVMTPYSRPHVSQSYVYETKDKKWLALHMSSPVKFWENLAIAVGKPNMFDDPRFSDRFARIDHYEDIVAELAPLFKGRPLDEWCQRLSDGEVPHSPMYTSEEVLETRQAKHLQLKLSTKHRNRGDFHAIRFPVTFDKQLELDLAPAPELGEHNGELLEN